MNHYVYIIKSKKVKKYFYIGYTTTLEKRLKEHNTGEQKSTYKRRPYKLSWYCVFSNKLQALRFEKYLKSGSGTAFRNKRLQ